MLFFGKHLRHFSADQHIDQLFILDAADRPGSYILPVAKYCERIRQFEYLFQTVGDINNAHSHFL